jgi:hypothetical protein
MVDDRAFPIVESNETMDWAPDFVRSIEASQDKRTCCGIPDYRRCPSAESLIVIACSLTS